MEKTVKATLTLNGKTFNALVTDEIARELIHVLAKAGLPSRTEIGK